MHHQGISDYEEQVIWKLFIDFNFDLIFSFSQNKTNYNWVTFSDCVFNTGKTWLEVIYVQQKHVHNIFHQIAKAGLYTLLLISVAATEIATSHLKFSSDLLTWETHIS